MCDCKSDAAAHADSDALPGPTGPPEKNPAWGVGRIRRPFLETLKRTDKKCRSTWLCCGNRTETVELDSAGRSHKRNVTLSEDGELESKVVNSSAKRRQEGPRWRGLVALLAACAFSMCGSCIMWSTDVFDDFVANQMILDESTSTFDWWVNPPISPWFKVHIWNYTNWDEYLRDPTVKIKLQEVGPFTYRETIKRENIEFSEDRTSVSYTEAKSYNYTSEMSRGDLNGTVIVPNLPYFGATAKYAQYWGVSSFFLEPLNMIKPLVTVNANDFIWGYEDALFQLSKIVPSSNVPMDRVGLMTSKKIPDTMTILTGSSDVDRLSYFLTYNDKQSLDAWPDAACNKLDGSDGSMFPPRKVRAKLPLLAYKAEACRIIQFTFQKTSTAQGVEAHRYIIDRNTFNSPRTYPGNLCYCNRTDLSECAPDGLFDTSPCSYGAPTLISYPHFFLTDPAVAEPFEGLHPDPEEHDMFADIHPRLGMTLQGRSRLQLNVRVMVDQPKLGLRKGMVLPVAWFAQDLPSYEPNFKTFLIVATYGLDALEFVLRFILPALALVTASVIARRLLQLRRQRNQSLEEGAMGHQNASTKETIMLSG